MLPTLHQPMVLEVGPLERTRIGDVLVFDDGRSLVAHRLVSLRPGMFITAGDAHPERLESVPRERVVGRVTRVFAGLEAGSPILYLRGSSLIGRVLVWIRLPRILWRTATRMLPFRRPRRFATLVAATRAALAKDRSGLERALRCDRSLVIDEARRRRLRPFITEAAQTLFSDGDREPIRIAATFQAQRIGDRARTVLNEFARVGIDALPLKGAHRSLYEPDVARTHPSSDVDILVRPTDLARACEVLRMTGHAERGLESNYRSHHHAAPYAGTDNIPVELHVALAPSAVLPGRYDAQTLESHVIRDGDRLRFDDVATLLHLLIHQVADFNFRDTVLCAHALAREPGLLDRLPPASFRVRALACYAAALAGLPCSYRRLERAYGAWIERREDLPAWLRERSQAIDALIACAAGDVADARCALAFGTGSSPTRQVGQIGTAVRILSRIVVAPVAATFAWLLPPFRTG
ncbi:MAG: nucleotidyltransferase family protein [Vulcanimicrobiaceae bacterium]